MTYEKKFTGYMILNCLDTEQARAVVVIKDCVGCSRNTAKALLDKLEYEGKIKKVTIEGLGFGYVKTE